MKTRITRSISRPPQAVFDYVSDPANNAKWQGPTEFARWTSDGSPGVGSTLNSVAKFFGRTMEFDYEITLWDPPNAFGFNSIEGSLPFQSDFGFASDGEGGTELTFNTQGELSGPFKFAEGLIVKQFKKQLEADFDALKEALEAEQR